LAAAPGHALSFCRRGPAARMESVPGPRPGCGEVWCVCFETLFYASTPTAGNVTCAVLSAFQRVGAVREPPYGHHMGAATECQSVSRMKVSTATFHALL